MPSTRPGLVYLLGDSVRNRVFPPLDELFAREEPPGETEADPDDEDGPEIGPEAPPEG